MRNPNIYIVAAMMFFLMSCENYLTKEIEFRDVGFEPRIVVNSKFNSLDNFLDISLSKNIDFANSDGGQKFEFVDADLISLKVGDRNYEALDEKPSGAGSQYYNYRFVLDEEDLSNKPFELEADAKGFPSIKSTFDIHSRAQITEIKRTEEVRTIDFDGETYDVDNLQITFEDVDNVKNFFGLELRSGGEVIEMDPKDPNLELTNRFRILFDDTSFINGKKTISIDILSLYFEETVRLRYLNMSEENYKYENSVLNYEESQGFGVFAEPVTVYSNVQGGHGIFAINEIIDVEL